MKIGIFGGTFNPPHLGHVRLAKAAVKALGLDKVMIIPSSIPPHKIAGSPLDAHIRLEMCKLAFDEPIFEVSDIEIKRGDKSYTVDTLRQLKEIYPNDELWFIMGSDMLSTFTQWYRWEEILSLAKICAASRKEGFKPDLSVFTNEQKDRIVFLNEEPLEISSTEIRSLVKSDSDGNGLIPEKVLEYIKSKKLYDDEFDRYRKIMYDMLDEARLYHSECVSEAAESLAKKYGANPEKAKLAGLLHDITKRMPGEEQLRLIGEVTPLERENYKVWHQMSGPAFLKEKGLVEDEEILDAIRWHTTGKANMSLLAKIVYTADFISADRDYPDVEVVRRLAYISLEHAMLYTGRYTINSLVALDRPVHPSTLECYNDTLRHFGL